MKNIRKILCVLTASVMILSVSSCGKNKSEDIISDIVKSEDLAKNPVKSAEAAVNSFMSAICDLDLKKAAQYVDNDIDLSNLPFEDAEGFKNIIRDGIVGNGDGEFAAYSDKTALLGEKVADAIIDNMGYSIKGSEIDGDEAKIKVGFTTMDFEDFNNKFSEAYSSVDIGSIINELANDGVISPESTHEQIAEVLMPKLFDRMLALVDDAVKNTEIVEKEAELYVFKDGSKWLINAEKSDLSLIGEAFSVNNDQ